MVRFKAKIVALIVAVLLSFVGLQVFQSGSVNTNLGNHDAHAHNFMATGRQGGFIHKSTKALRKLHDVDLNEMKYEILDSDEVKSLLAEQVRLPKPVTMPRELIDDMAFTPRGPPDIYSESDDAGSPVNKDHGELGHEDSKQDEKLERTTVKGATDFDKPLGIKLKKRCGNAHCAGIFCEDTYIRNCITGDVIGRIISNHKLSDLNISNTISKEDPISRQKYFYKLFKSTFRRKTTVGANTGLAYSGLCTTLSCAQEVIGVLHSLIVQLKTEFNKKKIKLLDVACGDFDWMNRFLRTRDDIDYTCIDTIPELIKNHRKKYRLYPWKFSTGDILNMELESYDIIFSRMMIQHLFFKDILDLLQKFSNSNSSYLLTTTFSGHKENVELSGNDPGPFRPVNLELPPVSLQAPLCLQMDGSGISNASYNSFLGLWKLPLQQIVKCQDTNLMPIQGTDQFVYSCSERRPAF